MNDNSKESAFGFSAQLNGESVYNHGLTKREYFAAMAMQSLIRISKIEELMMTNAVFDNYKNKITSRSVEIAESLLKALENNNSTEPK